MTATRWTLAFAALAGIVLVYRTWLPVNPTTVALTLLLLILIIAAEWGLRYAIVVSIAATACYNFFFLPPIGTFTISDPENWLALLAFLTTAVIASRLAQRARNQAWEARTRQREMEVLLQLSRELLEYESVSILLSSAPAAVASVTGARSGALYLLDGDRLYQAGEGVSEIELPHLRQMAETLSASRAEGDEMQIPLRTGVRPKGLLLLRGAGLSGETATAIGGLLSFSIDRAQALESVARGAAAKEGERLRTVMIDSITHELQTPLATIQSAVGALLERDGGDAEQRGRLGTIRAENDHLNKLVSEAIEMAQLDAQQVQMHFSAASVRDLVIGACELCGWARETHPLQLQVPHELMVRADAMLLQKVLCNLLENAAKYSKDGTPITISAEATGNEVTISVADRGAGIDPGEQSLIFERFYRARTQAEGTSGTGMGLAISRSITEAHGGRISVVSQVGSGSVFTVHLPVAH